MVGADSSPMVVPESVSNLSSRSISPVLVTGSSSESSTAGGQSPSTLTTGEARSLGRRVSSHEHQAAQPCPPLFPPLTHPWPASLQQNGRIGASELQGPGASDPLCDVKTRATISPNDTANPLSTAAMLHGDSASHLSLAETASIIKRPSPFDVVLEDNMAATSEHCNQAGSPSSEHHSTWYNATFAEMLASHAEAFSLAPLSTQALIVQAIASRIHKTNGRFLERYGKGWKEIAEKNSIFLGIARALFHQVQLSHTSSTTQKPLAPPLTNPNDVSAHSSVAAHRPNALLTDSASTLLHPNPNSVLQLYLEPMRSSDTMASTSAKQSSNAATVSESSPPIVTSRVAKVSLPMSANSTQAKARVVKRGKSAKKSTATNALHNHNPDGTFAKKHTTSFPKKKGESSSTHKKRSPTSPPSIENAASFDPQTWFANFGTPKAMEEHALQIMPTLSVEVIPRGVTVRPSGKWQAQFYFDGQSRYIGVFDGSYQAALAYECVHRLLAGFRELSRMKKPYATNALSKEQTRSLFDNAREGAVKAVAVMKHRPNSK